MGNASSVAYAEEAPEETSTPVEESPEAPVESEEVEKGGADPETEAEDGDAKTITVSDVKTAPMDFRFPTTNQAKHCFTRYNEFHKCAAEKGEDDEDCKKYAKYYRSICPGEWVDKWNEQKEEGTYTGRY